MGAVAAPAGPTGAAIATKTLASSEITATSTPAARGIDDVPAPWRSGTARLSDHAGIGFRHGAVRGAVPFPDGSAAPTTDLQGRTSCE
jgi:hypothetical protein